MNCITLKRSVRRAPLLTLIVSVIALCAPQLSSAAYPTKVVAMGDSITQAAMTCPLLISCPANSWATGSNPAVNSIYSRLRAINSRTTATNVAVSGAKVLDTWGQAGTAILYRPQLVSIMIGANDACATTTASEFHSRFQATINRLKAGIPKAKIVVASVPNLRYLYDLFKDDPAAVAAWNTTGFCPAMTSAPDEATRVATMERVNAFNASLASICAAYANCTFDGLLFFNYQFAKSEVSTLDYFHPSIAGQASIANASWPLVPNTF